MNGAEGVSSARCHPYPRLCLAAYLLLDAFRDIDKQPWRRCGSPYSIRGTNGIGCGAWQPFSCAILLRGEEIDKDVLAEKTEATGVGLHLQGLPIFGAASLVHLDLQSSRTRPALSVPHSIPQAGCRSWHAGWRRPITW